MKNNKEIIEKVLKEVGKYWKGRVFKHKVGDVTCEYIAPLVANEGLKKAITLTQQNCVDEFSKRLNEEIKNIDLKTALGRNRLPSVILVEVENNINKIAKGLYIKK